MASMLVSGNAALQTNSDRHFTASWNESMAAAKCSWKVIAGGGEQKDLIGSGDSEEQSALGTAF